jgi:hypothetical protein
LPTTRWKELREFHWPPTSLQLYVFVDYFSAIQIIVGENCTFVTKKRESTNNQIQINNNNNNKISLYWTKAQQFHFVCDQPSSNYNVE